MMTGREAAPVFGVWLTAQSAAEYLDFSRCADPVRAFRKWLARLPADRRVVPGYRGDVPVYMRTDLDHAVRIQRPTTESEQSHAKAVAP